MSELNGRPRIVQIITRAECGGAQVQLATLLESLQPHVENHVICGESGYLQRICRDLRVPFYVVPELVRAVSPKADVAAFRSMLALGRRLNPDLIHCHTAKAGIIGRLAAAALARPSIYTPHGYSFTPRNSLPVRTLAWVAELALRPIRATTIAVSQYEQRVAVNSQVTSRARVQVIPNGVPDAPRSTAVSDNPPHIVMVARFAYPKNHETVVRACALISGPFRLTFVGDGVGLARVKTLTAELGLSARVEFAGARTDVSEVLRHASIFVHSSFSEAQPMCLIEGMRAGLPTVASAVGGVPEVVVDGQTGFLVPPCAPTTFASRIAMLISDPALRERFGNAGRTRYELLFRSDSMVDKTLHLYNQTLRDTDRRKTVA